MEFIEYSKCSTCKKAKTWLEEHNIKFKDREIKEETPTIEELENWINKYNINTIRLFNTSGIKYRELNLKEKVKVMSQREQIELLSSDGMLIKRPILVDEDNILIGFKENEWKKHFNDREE